MDEKVNLIKRRGQEKAKLTNFKKFVEDWTVAEGTRILRLRLDKIDLCWKEFTNLQSQIELLNEKEAPEGIVFENSYFETIGKALDIL